jgi:hypothetical protein
VQHAVHSQLVPISEVARRVGIKSIDVAERYANRGRQLRKLGMGQELATRAGRLPDGSGGDASEADLASTGASAPEAALGAGPRGFGPSCNRICKTALYIAEAC